MLSVVLEPARAARRLLQAARAAGTLRALGDVEGHEFHGNQWTARAGRNEKSLAKTDVILGGASVYRDPSVTDSDAPGKLKSFADDVNPDVLARARITAIYVYDNPEGAVDGIRALVGDRVDVPDNAQGVFDRESRTLVATLWRSGALEETGETFYHELGHASEHLITDPKWEDTWSREWSQHDQDEGFAHAFADYHLSKREGSGGDYGDVGEFQKLHLLTYELFKDWKL